MKSWIKVTALDGVVTISATIADTAITFVGASCPASVQSGSSGLSSFSLAPKVGTPAVVAMSTKYLSPMGKTTAVYEGYILSITWDGEKAICNLKEDFVPRADALATVSHDGMLTLISGEHKFVFASESPTRCKLNNHVVNNGFRELKDSNPMLKFVNGDITIDELLKVAGPTMAEIDAAKITELTKEVQDLKEKLATATESRDAFSTTIDEVRSIVSNHRWRLRTKLMKVLGLVWEIST